MQEKALSLSIQDPPLWHGLLAQSLTPGERNDCHVNTMQIDVVRNYGVCVSPRNIYRLLRWSPVGHRLFVLLIHANFKFIE